MASGVYAKGLGALMSGSIDWDTDTINAQLTTSSYTVNLDTHDFRDDVNTYQATGADDVAVGSKAIAYDAGSNYVYLDCAASITFTTVTAGTCAGVVLYKSVGTPATDPLICWLEFSGTVTANGSDIQVNFDTNGAVRITY